MIENVTSTHLKVFGEQPDLIVRAPGRVNLIGEHTDYNGGFVFPVAIDFYTYVCVSKRSDILVRAHAMDMTNQKDQFSLNGTIHVDRDESWRNYVRGAFHSVLALGHTISGCNISVSGNIPQGAGLSSSASLQVAIIKAISELYNLDMTAKDIAKYAQKAENEFVGVNCGIMDQLASACGQDNSALMIDCEDLSITPTSIPDTLSILIINSNKERALVGSEYNDRRSECERVAQHFSVPSLRKTSVNQLLVAEPRLDPIDFKRAYHILTENERVLAFKDALKANNTTVIAKLMKDSHISMRDDFEITTPEIDFLAETLQTKLGNSGGARMTGGGFGGCVVALMPKDQIETVEEHALAAYKDKTGIEATAYTVNAVNGVEVVS